MVSEYTLVTTSADSVIVSDVPLPAGPERNVLTRRVARITLVHNARNALEPVKVTLLHQRRQTKNEPWSDADAFDLRTLTAGQEVRLELNPSETIQLYAALTHSYAMTESGLPVDQSRLAVVDPDTTYIATGMERDTLLRLLDQEGERFWDIIQELRPGLLEAVVSTKVHEARRLAVAEFEAQLQAMMWSEGDWEKFFRANNWIFGHGLMYQFLSEIRGQPHYGGVNLTGTGAQRGDFLMATQADTRFTVLVEMKKPQSALVTSKEYRRKVYELGEDLVGGVSQLQSCCRTWVIEGSRQEENTELLEEQRTYTYEPRAILVLGHTSQLDTMNKKATFELFRRNLHNPEVVTFDELLARAKFLVSVEETHLPRESVARSRCCAL